MTDASLNQAIYLDTNFFIKAVEGTQETSSAPKELLRALRDRRGLAATSEITFAETLAPTKRSDALPVHIKRRVYLDLLLWSGFIELIPVSRDILIETADLQSARKLKLPDAIHLVSAIQRRCRYMVSGDSDFDRLPAGMTRVEPDERGITELLRTIT